MNREWLQNDPKMIPKLYANDKTSRKNDDRSNEQNYKNMEKRWQRPAWDPEQEYSGPWQWGTTSFSYNSELYSGKGESLKEFFEPSAELEGRLSVFQTPDEVISLANIYLGIPFCSEDGKQMKKIHAFL